MHRDRGTNRSPFRVWMSLSLALVTAVMGATSVGAPGDGPAPLAVPASRQAQNVAIITVEGAIDAVTARSVQRRLTAAADAGADGIVIEVNSPGGELGAVLEISNAIKLSPIANTVAWINPQAYSGGAIIALACREMVVNDPSSMGDAFPITFGPEGVRGLSADERKKFLPPLLADVAESARRSGYDEYLVQAIVIDGVELWAVRNAAGELYCIDEAEYRAVFGTEPVRGKPMLSGVGEVGRAADQPRPASPARNAPAQDAEPEDAPPAEAVPEESEEPASEAEPEAPMEETDPLGDAPVRAPPSDEAATFNAASPTLEELAGSVSALLDTPSDRPIFDASQRGQWQLVGYVSDGTGPVVLRSDEMEFFGFSTRVIRNDEELKAFFGATNLRRVDESWSEGLVRFMTNPIVRGVLIVALLIGAFLEMTSPGLVVPGAVAAGALIGLVLPPAIIGMAGWWEVAAIAVGFLLLGVELLVLPGFGVFGLIGLVAIFFGIVGTFMPDPASQRFPGLPGETNDGLYGMVVTLLAMATAGVGIFFIVKHMNSLPMLNRLVLVEGIARDGGTSAEAEDEPSIPPMVGAVGVTTTPLRPSGRVEINGVLHDAISALGYVESGASVRVVGVRGASLVVERAEASA